MAHLGISEVLARPAPEAWRAFLLEWYGIEGSDGFVPEVQMPWALRDFYEFAGTAAEAFVTNRLLAPDAFGTDTGHVVFYDEEQDVYRWGIAEARSDGLHWPYHDGLKWPHFPSVDVPG